MKATFQNARKFVFLFFGTLFIGSSLMGQEAKGVEAEVKGETVSQKTKGRLLDYSAILPKGKTLPSKVFRIWVPSRLYRADQVYNDSGDLVDAPVDVEVRASALVMEYGITDDLSIQVLTPYLMKNSVSLQVDRSLPTAVKTLAGALAQSPAVECQTVTACETWINAGNTIPQNLTLNNVEIPAGTPAVAIARQVVISQKSEVDGEKAVGLGDVEIGALYRAFETESLMIAAGLGVRLPTGTFGDAELLDTGRGTTDLGLRLNVDYALTRAALFSWEHQFERMLISGEKEIPSTAGAVENQKFERIGVRSKGVVQMGYNLGSLSTALKSLGVTLGATYDLDAEKRIEGEVQEGGLTTGRRSQVYAANATLVVNGLDYNIPGSIEIEYARPFQGKNVVATSLDGVILKGYYRF